MLSIELLDFLDGVFVPAHLMPEYQRLLDHLEAQAKSEWDARIAHSGSADVQNGPTPGVDMAHDPFLSRAQRRIQRTASV